MKTRLIVPGIIFGSFTALIAVSQIWAAGNVLGCNAGQAFACKDVLEHDFKRITSEKGKALIKDRYEAFRKRIAAEKRAEERRQAEAKRFKPDRYNVMMLASSCAEKNIKPMLKDPYSFREIQHGYNMGATTIDVTVEYTATNGFGGRVRNNHTCTYTR